MWRQFYVAMEHAKDDLYLRITQRSFVHQQARNGDRHVFASRSRFIPAGIADRFEPVVWPRRRQHPEPPSGTATAPVVDLKARLGGMWKQRG